MGLILKNTISATKVIGLDYEMKGIENRFMMGDDFFQ